MEILTAKTAGFCFGVERAVKTAYDEAEKGGIVYTFGPIVHNDTVISELEKKGVKVIQSEDELDMLPMGTVIIRAHGVTRALEEKMKRLGFRVVDATCPFVKKIHRIADEETKNGEPLIVIGDPNHPEVQGIIGWANSEVFAVKEPEDVENIPFSKEITIKLVIQTTFQLKKAKIIIDLIEKQGYIINNADTICNATRERQLEADEIAAKSDVVLVIGGEHSSNSQKLYEICNKHCSHTHFIQTAGDINPDWFRKAKTVGITAGASTPKIIITEVQTECQNLNNW